ncbi:MAG: hypothetical protein KAX50_07735 [Saprospiraceae bacterium]|nr:hypothetical protein [Saprospiraceae bacterium]
MKKASSIKSQCINEIRRWSIWILPVLIFIALLLAKEIIGNEYWDIADAIALVIVIGLLLLCIILSLIDKEIEVTSRALTLKNRFGKKVIPAKDIQGYKEEKFIPRIGGQAQLIFKANNRYYVIEGASCLNYLGIVKFVREHYRELSDDHFRRYYFIRSIGIRLLFIVAGTMFIYGFFHNRSLDIAQWDKDVELVPLTLSEQPHIKAGGKKVRNYLRFFAKEYPEFEFKINGFRYESCERTTITALEKGATIMVGIQSSDVETKLKKSIPPSFWTQHHGWKQIVVYQLMHNETALIHKNIVKKLMLKEQKLAWIALAMGVAFISMAFFWTSLSPPHHTKVAADSAGK